MDRAEEAGQDVWYCVLDHAWPILAWEKDSRFGYTLTVTVQEGDSLWKLADAVYGDGHFWTQIYEENQERIGGDANLILPGTDLGLRCLTAATADREEGTHALQCTEFLCGEGGNAHGVGATVFILTWDADGVCRVADWRVEGWMD